MTQLSTQATGKTPKYNLSNKAPIACTDYCTNVYTQTVTLLIKRSGLYALITAHNQDKLRDLIKEAEIQNSDDNKLCGKNSRAN